MPDHSPPVSRDGTPKAGTPVRDRGPRVALSAAAAGAAIMLALELRAVGGDLSSFGILALDLLALVPLAWASSWLLLAARAGSAGRIAGCLAFGVASLPLGLALGRGAGLARAGLSWLPAVAVPLLVIVLVWAATRLLALAPRSRVPLLSVPVLAAALAARLINFRLFVGLYAPVHDALFLAELAAWSFGLTLLFGGAGGGSSRAWRAALAAFVVTAAASWLLLPVPIAVDADTRATIAAADLHGARFLRWRGAGADAFRPVELDRDLVRSFATWNEQARARATDVLPEDRRWNLVLISIDTLRADRVGCIGDGSARSLTPNLDAFGREATVFRRAWAQYPSTHLSVASLFTGRHPRATELYRALATPPVPGDLPELRFVPTLKQAGFVAAAVVAFTEQWMGQASFRHWLDDFDLLNPDLRGRPSLDAKWYVDSARAALDAAGDRRFFLWFHIFEPHHPYERHERFDFGSGVAERYDGEVAYADARVGELLADIDRRGRRDDTVVVIASDHGESLGEDGLRYHGSALSPEQLRVPLLIRVPGGAAGRIDANVGNVDLMETMRTLLSLPEAPPTQGRDLTPFLFDEIDASGWTDLAYAELPDDVKDLSAASSNVVAVMLGRDRLVRHLSLGYDEARGPGADDPERRAALERALVTMADWTAEFGRSRQAAASRTDERDEIVAQLGDDDPFRRLAALRRALGSDAFDLEDRVREMALRSDEHAEIRIAALAGVGARMPAEDVIALSRAGDPALAWTALRALPLGSAELAPMPGAATPLRDEIVLHALARAPTAAGIERATALATSWLAPKALRARAALALAAAGRSDLAVRALGAGDLARELARSPELVDRIAERDLFSAYRLAMTVAPDRYLPPALRDRFLDLAARLDDRPALELGRMLLSGWDPAFHRRAVAVFERRFGAASTAAAARARAHEIDAEAAPGSEDWTAWREATGRALAEAPAAGGLLRLTVTHALAALAVGAFAEAETALAAAEAARALEPLAARDLERTLLELRAHRPAAGPLSEDAAIAVTDVTPSTATARFAAPGQRFVLSVALSNDWDRALLGGTTPMTGRLRVLWTREGGSEIVYGSEVALDPGILPGEKVRRAIVVSAPQAPGDWRGLVIVHQQGGPRFHVHESAAATFDLRVIDPAAPLLPERLVAAELAAHLEPEPGFFDWGLRGEEGPLVAVAADYQRGFALPAVPLPAGAVLELDLSWLSAHEDASAVTLATTAGAVVGRVEIARDGRRALVRVPIAAPPSDGSLRVVVGGRPGILELHGLAIRR